MVHLIVGLGNPGKEYADTRHNLGFRVVEELARRGRLTWEKPRLKAEQARGTLNGQEIVLAKPQTYMNDSGVSVVQLVRWYKVPLDRLLIIYDELDLPYGQLRIRGEGSSGGHNGMGSIIQHLGTAAIPRLKSGIGRPSFGDPIKYVLSRFSKEQEAELPALITRAADAAETWLTAGLLTAMNTYNRPPAPKPAPSSTSG